MSAHYDRVAADGQIRQAQIARDSALERAFDAASESAHIDLAEMADDELAHMIGKSERLSDKLGLLLEAVAKLGLNTPHQPADVQYAAANLFGAMLDQVSEAKAQDLRLWGAK